MKQTKISMDRFKIITAILIIAIHIAPLSSINENIDFLFTHVICRIGVPFFLMVTGFFVLPKALENRKALVQYTIKIIKIYILCIIIYLPVNIYAKQLIGIGVLGILKKIFIVGTFYHLWYFPALILGIWITYFITKYFGKKKSIIIVFVLYTIGLFGDSYYGIIENITFIENIYQGIFDIFDYTRNGIFYVPMFLYLGYVAKDRKWQMSRKNNIFLILLFFILMIAEGIILRYFDLQRHDSMYIMLIPTMIFIFNFIIQNNQQNSKRLRNIATTIYVIHPMFIIIVRGIAKILHLQNILIDNSLIHYILVVILTVLFSICLEKIKEKIGERSGRTDSEG